MAGRGQGCDGGPPGDGKRAALGHVLGLGPDVACSDVCVQPRGAWSVECGEREFSGVHSRGCRATWDGVVWGGVGWEAEQLSGKVARPLLVMLT